MNPKNSYLGYAFAFVWDVCGIYYVINGTLSTDTLFSWFIHNISSQFRILNLRLKLVAEEGNDTGRIEDGDSHEWFRKTLIECVLYHRAIIDLVDSFNEVYRLTVFVKFLISCLQIAFLGFQFARGGELAGQIFHLSFLVSVSIQLMLYCYGGQRLKDEVSITWENTGYAFYSNYIF